MSSAARTAVVVGGGLAGTSAALELADRGWQVTLLESRSRLGGAVYSFERDGLHADTGQHALLRCYHAYRALLDRVGAAQDTSFQERLEIPVLRPGQAPARLRRAKFGPAPAHLLPALLGYHLLSVPERLSAARAMASLRAVDPFDPTVDAEPFGRWLRRHGQSERAIAALWALVTVPALNITVDQASLALAAQVFQTGLLSDVEAGDIGLVDVPLSDVHDAATRRHLGAVGVRCETRCRVRSVDVVEDSLLVRTATGEVSADAVVVAIPHRGAIEVVPAVACPGRDRWAELGSSAIVSVHVHYDRPVTDLRFGAALGSAVPWFFDRTTAAGVTGQYLVVPISAADAELDSSADQLLARHLAALGDLFPRAAAAKVLDGFVTREPHATFRQQAGTAKLRPAAHTRLPALSLAGAWTDTGWPDTMEGAVRSGQAAAVALDRVRAYPRLTEVAS